MFPNYLKLKEYVAQGWVDEMKHSTLPLRIYNYSRKTQFEKKWDEITLQTRGLILDDKGNVVAKCLPKFFNYEEVRDQNLPLHETPIIQEKVDGSLGIIFWYNGWNIATRGSFNSIQAQKGAQILEKYNSPKFNKNYTYLVEIIYPENRIVIDYGNEEKLIFLSVIDLVKGELLSHDFVKHLIDLDIPYDSVVNLDVVQNNALFSEEVFKYLKQNQEKNKEGYIIKFEPSGYRVKVKFEEYIRLHRIITDITSYDIWEALKVGEDISKILIDTPDEFDDWVRNKIEEITKQYKYIENICFEKKELLVGWSLVNHWDHKQQAAWIQFNVIKRYQGIVFRMLDNGDYKSDIWKYCKPKYEKPFLNNG